MVGKVVRLLKCPWFRNQTNMETILLQSFVHDKFCPWVAQYAWVNVNVFLLYYAIKACVEKQQWIYFPKYSNSISHRFSNFLFISLVLVLSKFLSLLHKYIFNAICKLFSYTIVSYYQSSSEMYNHLSCVG